MGVDFRIREAGVRDALEVLTLRRAVLAEDQFFISREDELHTTVELQIRRIAEMKISASEAMFVAREDAVLGFVVLQATPFLRMRHVVKLEVLVASAVRGQGIGRALLEAGIAWAEESKTIEKVGLAVFADNARALALYTDLGFLEEGRRLKEYIMEDGSYRDDVLLFRPT